MADVQESVREPASGMRFPEGLVALTDGRLVEISTGCGRTSPLCTTEASEHPRSRTYLPMVLKSARSAGPDAPGARAVLGARVKLSDTGMRQDARAIERGQEDDDGRIRTAPAVRRSGRGGLSGLAARPAGSYTPPTRTRSGRRSTARCPARTSTPAAQVVNELVAAAEGGADEQRGSALLRVRDRRRAAGGHRRRRAHHRVGPVRVERGALVCRPATSTPAPATTWGRQPRWAANTPPGCTSTARSACGPPPRRRAPTSPTAPSSPTRGPATDTSGSSCPTTRASRSAPGPTCTSPR